jgi:hypothetical protein
MDDQENLSSHMTKSSGMMFGTSMQIVMEPDHTKSVGSRLRECGVTNDKATNQLRATQMLKQTAAGLAAMFMLGLPTFAQVAPGTVELPEICKAGMHQGMGSIKMDMPGMEMPGMDEPHADLGKGMHETNAHMMQGMTAKDIDVAFVCAMIPHHQDAINMARAEIVHGDNEWAREMAKKVIEAQENEIADMLNWLKAQK